MAARIKKNDQVKVIAGRDKGAIGQVLVVDPARGKVIVEGVNKVKRHQRPTPHNPEGGIVEKELPIDDSNVMVLDPKDGKPTRIRMGESKDGRKVRIAVKSGSVLDS